MIISKLHMFESTHFRSPDTDGNSAVRCFFFCCVRLLPVYRLAQIKCINCSHRMINLQINIIISMRNLDCEFLNQMCSEQQIAIKRFEMGKKLFNINCHINKLYIRLRRAGELLLALATRVRAVPLFLLDGSFFLSFSCFFFIVN